MQALLSETPPGRPLRGLAASVAVHVLLLAVIVLVGAPSAPLPVKRGEPLFIELPDVSEPAPRGNPAAKTPGPVAAAPTRPAAPAPARPAPRPEPRTAKAAPAPRPAPRAPEPPRPAPATPPAAVARPDPTDPTGPLPAPGETARADAARPEAPRPSPPQVAAAPPAGGAPGVDIRAALGRGGGAGGRSEGRGGIEGEPIPLDSPDPKYSDYLDRVRRKIKEQWGYPCVKNTATRGCDFKSAQLIIEFGIAKDGKVPFVHLVRSSGWEIYDEYALNAVKLASPFPPVPDVISKKGIPIVATFNYILDTGLTNLLR